MSRYCRKDKVELLGEKRCVALPEVDPKAIAEHEETVFSTSISPSELYQELVASYCAAAVVDLSPAQGEFCKACLASRTKIVAVLWHGKPCISAGTCPDGPYLGRAVS